jgi:hypothetical protein
MPGARAIVGIENTPRAARPGRALTSTLTRPIFCSSAMTTPPGRRHMVAGVEMGQQHRRADRRVAGEGQFGGRREDAHRGRIDRIARRADEHRFGEVELARDGLHPRHIVLRTSASASSTTASGLPASCASR